MSLHDTADVRQADAGPFELRGAVQALEHAEQLVAVGSVEADTVVLDADDDLVILLDCENLDARLRTRPRVLHCVGQQVQEHLVQQGAVAADVRQLLQSPLDLAILDLGLELRDDRLDEAVEIDGRPAYCRAADAGEREQIVDELTHALRSFANTLEPALLVRVQPGERGFLDHADIRLDVTQRHAQVVRYRMTERFQVAVRCSEILVALFEHHVQLRYLAG